MFTDRFDLFAIWKDFSLLAPDSVGKDRSLLAPALTVLCGIICILLLWLFFRRFRAGSRSYADAGIMSGAVFAFMSFVEWAVLSVNNYSEDMFIYFDMILLYQTYIPFMLFSLLLFLSNSVLILREDFHFRNLLAALFGLITAAGIHIAFALNCLDARWIGDLFIDVFASMFFLFFSSVFFGMAATCFVYSHQRPSLDRDYAIVLGCRVIGGKPTPLLAARIDTALCFYRKQLEKTGKAPLFILSGGKGSDEELSEAEAMYRYLLEKGVPETAMLLEDSSASTRENFINSKAIIDKKDPRAKGVFSTTNFHIFRSELMCKKIGLNASGLAAPVRWYYLPNAFIREMIATFYAEKKPLLISILCMLLITLGITLWQWFVIHSGAPMF